MLKTTNKLPAIIFLSIELILWILILTGGYIGITNVIPIQYASVIIAACFALIFRHKFSFGQLAFICIVIADLFLTYLRPQKLELGVAFFIFAAVLFAVIISKNIKENIKVLHIVLRVLLSLIALIIMRLLPNSNTLLVLTGIYGVNLIMNVIFSFQMKNKNTLFSVGLILFLCCDIFVGLSAARELNLISLNQTFIYDLLTGHIFNLAWFFYVPSLTLIAISFQK